MDEYSDYTIDELILSADFRKKVAWATPKEAEKISKWLKDHPEQRHKFAVAIETIRAVQPAVVPLSDRQQKEAVESILKLTSHNASKRPAKPLYPTAVAVAAAAVLILGFLWFKFQPGDQVMESKTLMTQNTSETIYIKNSDVKKSELISLSDGSIVILKPGSSLRYPAVFEAGRRDVELTGEAFFEISKDTLKPFYVFANESVTRVLGTSFNIRAFENESQITVKVQTGKVSVSQLPAAKKIAPGSVPIVIEPDQKVAIDRLDGNVEKSTIKPDEKVLPALISDRANQEIPVISIFGDLQNAYGVSIEYDSTAMASQSIMANMGHLHLLEKLDAICLAVGATYRVEKGKIIISTDRSKRL